MKVLIVEDEEDARFALERHLSREGFDVLGVEDGHEAIERIDHPWDIIITDLIMDDVDGIEVLKAFTAAGHPAVKVVATSFADKHNTIQALNHGADYLLEKPFSIDQISGLIHSLLDQAHSARVRSVESDGDVIETLFERRLASLNLTPSEKQITALIVKGLSNRSIASACEISEQSVKNRILGIYRKLGIHSRAELMHLVFPI